LKRKKSVQRDTKPLVSLNKPAPPNNFLRLILPEVQETSNSNRSTLPVLLTPFIGRQPEVDEVCQLISNPSVHLVTLYGTAGTGKTRLSLAVAQKLSPQFQDGVFFVNLAPLNKPELGLAAIAQTLGLQDHSQLSLFKKLQNYLHKRELLLILDNFEQILALSSAISELLLAAPQLKVLVTSRVVLRLYGENVYTVPTLQLLELAETTSFETLCQNEAVSLFSQRASMINSEFKLTEENARIIAKLCIHLEGLPLAIELAAARCDVFSPQTLLDRLGAGKRFELLVGGFSNLPQRQQTLVDAIEWSYQLLSETEKQLFRRAGIFVDSCSVAAVAEVLGTQPASTFNTIISLLNKSLLKQVEAMPGEELRFTMLETIREYALEKLIEAGELVTVRAAHSRYFMEMAETGEDHLKKPDHLNWLKRLAADHPNILSALDYLIESEQADGAFRLGSSIWVAWWRWGYLNQGRQWLDKILTLNQAEIENVLLAKVLDGVAYLAMYQSDYRTAETYFEQSLKIWRETGVSKYLGRAVSGLSGAYRILGNYDEALQLNYECLDLFRLLGDAVSEADSLCNIAWQLMERGNYEQVQSMLEESLAIHTNANYLSGVARAKIYLGDILWRKNDPTLAVQNLEEAVTLLRQINHPIRLPSALYRLGLIYLCQGKLDIAEKSLEESVEIAEEMHKTLELTYSYSSLGLLRMVQGNLAEAETLFQQSIKLRPEIGQLEGVLWALEGLAVVYLKQARNSQAQEIMEEVQALREAIAAPVLAHTLKFILPVLLNHNKTANHRASHIKAKSHRNVAGEALPSTSLPSDNQAASFSLDEAIVLSKRESEVLQLIAQGHQTSQIAKILVISPGTVNNHLNSIYSKLGVNSRTAAIRYALDHYLI